LIEIIWQAEKDTITFGINFKITGMILKRTVIIAVLLLLAAGCSDYFMICSLHPFYLEKDVVLLPGVEGSWLARPVHPLTKDQGNEKDEVWSEADTLNVWKIERTISRTSQKTKAGKDTTIINPMNYYGATLAGINRDTTWYHYKVVLFRVRNLVYADFTPTENSAFRNSRLSKENHFPVHTLASIKLEGNSLKVSWLGAEYMKEMIEKKRVRVSYKWVESAKRLLLTGSSEQLTGMIERYADEKRFIDWENQKAMLHMTRSDR
jgi:hypothetical protein